MNEHRRQILELLATGKITADEAEHLIAALGKEPPPFGSSASGSEAKPKPKPKYLRVLVEAKENRHGDASSPTTVNIRVPMQLLRAGVRLANFIPVNARESVNDALKDNGVEFDLNQLKPENLEEIIEQLSDLEVNVDHMEKDNNVKVRVFCE
jgi:hypothetical protein